jgi:uncharacterized protein YecE (DUF72 family)
VAKQGRLHIGTSGWHYKHWLGMFYPEKMPARDFLDFYAERLHTVEINNSFYRLPSIETMENWRENSPKGFLFAVKASRYITHMKKLKEPEEPLRNLYSRVEALKEKAGPILFQLPPSWKINLERLEQFLNSLTPTFRHVFEFRHPSWYDEQSLALLQQHKAAFCIYNLAGHESPAEVTADFVYVRLHGPGGAYQGLYSDKALQEWAEQMKGWSRKGLDVYVYFDNDQAGYAAQNAIRLQEMAA